MDEGSDMIFFLRRLKVLRSTHRFRNVTQSILRRSSSNGRLDYHSGICCIQKFNKRSVARGSNAKI